MESVSWNGKQVDIKYVSEPKIINQMISNRRFISLVQKVRREGGKISDFSGYQLFDSSMKPLTNSDNVNQATITIKRVNNNVIMMVRKKVRLSIR